MRHHVVPDPANTEIANPEYHLWNVVSRLGDAAEAETVEHELSFAEAYRKCDELNSDDTVTVTTRFRIEYQHKGRDPREPDAWQEYHSSVSPARAIETLVEQRRRSYLNAWRAIQLTTLSSVTNL